MKNNFVKLCSLFLSLLLLFSLAACNKKNQEAEGTEGTAKTFKPATEFGVTEYGWVSVNTILRDEDLLDWFEKSLSRASVNYAIFYAKDEATNIWYCWMYAEGYNATDTVTLAVDDSNGTHVHMNVTLQDPDADATGAFCFAIPSATEPTFSIAVNGFAEGIIVTLGSTPAIPRS